ncbi:GNAT family N-acetyltransferase [Streptomyces sp. CB01881]|uniref:GNAT family N-acetyltransferase n=1 Tax=Streptomyces sp. CB01881 TaxID=2078691 RepID=UPI000CDC3FD5|nr:GNAT family N-acetyltransferase [Streptomyces sp. CB01881]AUY51488.1 GNAT family N-acetyltransferase [Streptomyces sp. CB01881]TYC74881.1 GNAT family N-acetyltransferase [Streptomyces sp. CB01881]
MSTSSPALRLELITPATIDAALALKVRPDQEGLVAPVAKSLAEAYAYGDTAWPRLIFDGDRLVGFLMAFFDVRFAPGYPDDRPRSGLWRLNIGAQEQGRGYGRFAVEQVCAEIRRRGGHRVSVTYVPGDHGPAGFYESLGFRPTGELSGDQVVAELALSEG